MPRARKRASSPQQVEEAQEEMEQDEVEEDDADVPSVFSEELTWRPGKQIPVTELLRRLRTLYEELQDLEQKDENDPSRAGFTPKAQELANQQLLGHKDKGVKAYALLCITDMFRILAPDAPYKKSQLTTIFTLFASTVIPALANPSDPYNQQHTAVLQSLTSVKSIVLMIDLPTADKLILSVFANCFDVVAGGARDGGGEKLPKNLEYHMTQMLETLVDENENLPGEVVEMILAQFLRADPNAASSGKRKGEVRNDEIVTELSPAYNMARSICNSQGQKMNRAIGHYFSSVLVDASEIITTSQKAVKSKGKKRTHDESEGESDDGMLTPPAEKDLGEAEKAHRLLRELWRSSPDAIQDIIPQVETEIEAERPELRVMAVQALGDMIAGVGAGGLPSSTPLDPAAYPSQSLEETRSSWQPSNVLAPNAPHAFSSVHPTAYQKFVDRHKDKSAPVRSAWATGAGRVILTSGGGKGLDDDQERTLLAYLSDMLVDNDDRVRLAAVEAIAHFDFQSIVQKLGKSGSVSHPGSVLHNLADRIKDRKQHVRSIAMELLGRVWGVAAGAITEGRERVRELLGAIPSRIFQAMYVNDPEITALINRVLFDSLLPTSYPPIKPQSSSDPQRINDSQGETNSTLNPDTIRAERILTLVRDLEDKAKAVFFILQQRQAGNAKLMEAYLKAAEEVNKAQDKEKGKEQKSLETFVTALAKTTADPQVASEHLQKYAKRNDLRCNQLIRFCFKSESEYRKIINAMRELTKRVNDWPGGMAVVLETLLPLTRSAAILVYNRSHVPAILDISHTNEKDLGGAAHELLKEISTKAPEVFKVHVHELCESLKKQKPVSGELGDPAVVDMLKACAGFARRFPGGMPKDREFYQAMVAYACHGSSPKAAKHAVTVIVSAADKKEMYIKQIQKDCIQNFLYGDDAFLSKLASISQLKLLANSQCEEYSDAVTDIAIGQVLSQVRTVADESDPEWKDDLDDDISAKLWALRILVNGLRGLRPTVDAENANEAIEAVGNQVYKLLNTLVKKDGELSKAESTPKHHRTQLRLSAAKHLLKLSCTPSFDRLLKPHDFNQLSKVAQDENPEVRAGFVKALKKYLGAGVLSNRFYALVFLYAFEPNKDTMSSTTTWIKSRAAMSAKSTDHAMETAFARFLSLLAHHQDFSSDPEDLRDFVEYVLFFLKNAANQENLPIIYHLAQRIKAVQDGIDPEKSENLYILSDIAEAVIRQFQEEKGWSLQLMSGRVALPNTLFQKLPSHTVAQEIAEKKYIPDALAEDLEDLVKNSMKSKSKTKKRKSEGASTQAAKKHKSNTNGAAKALPVRKAPKPTKTPRKKSEETVSGSERRKSTRVANAANYAENDDSVDEEEFEQWQGSEDQEMEKELMSTPLTSDPLPPPAEKEAEEHTVLRKESSSKKLTPRKPAKPVQPARATRGKQKVEKKVRDIMDVPSDSE